MERKYASSVITVADETVHDNSTRSERKRDARVRTRGQSEEEEEEQNKKEEEEEEEEEASSSYVVVYIPPFYTS